MKNKPFKRGYAITAIWTEDPDPPQGQYEEYGDHAKIWASLPYRVKKEMLSDCDNFISYCLDCEIPGSKLPGDSEDAGGNFWLSRNGHGSGFFDSDWSDADRLQSASKICGSYDELWILIGNNEE